MNVGMEVEGAVLGSKVAKSKDQDTWKVVQKPRHQMKGGKEKQNGSRRPNDGGSCFGVLAEEATSYVGETLAKEPESVQLAVAEVVDKRLSKFRPSTKEKKGDGTRKQTKKQIMVRESCWGYKRSQRGGPLEVVVPEVDHFQPNLEDPSEVGKLSELSVTGSSKPSLLLLSETKTDREESFECLKNLGYDSLTFVPSLGRSGALLAAWNKDFISVSVLGTDRQFINLRCSIDRMQPFALIAIYAVPNESMKQILWQNLEDLASATALLWVIAGHFNDVLKSDERIGGAEALRTSNANSSTTSLTLLTIFSPVTTTLPSLKHSLSIALRLFFPLAGNLLCPPPPHKPFIHYTGDHSVALTVVEYTSDYFNIYSANSPKNLKDIYSLVPELSWSAEDEDVDGADPTFVFPILALQVTIFPNAGLCIAITYCHVMDASSCSHFMKTWASICRSDGGDVTFLEKSPPSYDREVIKDPRGLEAVSLRDYFKERSTWKDSLVGITSKRVLIDDDLYKSTIVFGREEIELLRKWGNKSTRYRDDKEEEKDEYFRFAADCRNRLEHPVENNYFGNCITRCHATLKRKEVKGEEGFLKAVKVIEKAIEDMKKEPLNDAEKWKENYWNKFALGSAVLATGSSNFTFYETDFGFGRPKKVEN
ncbi:hypothetical protein K1719_031298 [Acacia pycnantha]|nr:hypothetical protein K1719_031298 [Acacia pycnantha]